MTSAVWLRSKHDRAANADSIGVGAPTSRSRTTPPARAWRPGDSAQIGELRQWVREEVARKGDQGSTLELVALICDESSDVGNVLRVEMYDLGTRSAAVCLQPYRARWGRGRITLTGSPQRLTSLEPLS